MTNFFSLIALFGSVYFIAVATPGPAVIAVSARAMATGIRQTLPFIAGIVLGDLIWFSVAALGVAALAQNLHIVFLIIRYLGALYLAYLAYTLWTAPADAIDLPTSQQENGLKLFFGGLALCLGNPKAMLFFLAVLPGVVALDHISIDTFAFLAVMICSLLSGILVGYAMLATRIRSLMTHPHTIRRINRGSSLAMGATAIAVAAQPL